MGAEMCSGFDVQWAGLVTSNISHDIGSRSMEVRREGDQPLVVCQTAHLWVDLSSSKECQSAASPGNCMVRKCWTWILPGDLTSRGSRACLGPVGGILQLCRRPDQLHEAFATLITPTLRGTTRPAERASAQSVAPLTPRSYLEACAQQLDLEVLEMTPLVSHLAGHHAASGACLGPVGRTLQVNQRPVHVREGLPGRHQPRQQLTAAARCHICTPRQSPDISLSMQRHS